MLSSGSFASKLEAHLKERGMGKRTLAKLVEPDNVEQARKSIRRWMKGATPTQANRDLVTDALGLDRGSLDPDEEEESLMAPLTRAIRDAVYADPEAQVALRRMLDEAAA